jgi:hypothetical protein
MPVVEEVIMFPVTVELSLLLRVIPVVKLPVIVLPSIEAGSVTTIIPVPVEDV